MKQKSIKTKINFHYNKAFNYAEQELIRIVRIALKKNKNLDKFTIAMGTYFFQDVNKNILDDYHNKSVDKFISQYNNMFGLTGNPMIIRVDGEIVRDW